MYLNDYFTGKAIKCVINLFCANNPTLLYLNIKCWSYKTNFVCGKLGKFFVFSSQRILA